MNTYTPIGPFRFWCQKVLPLVYDDSLSYYEAISKIADKLNVTIETLNSILDQINGIDAQIEASINEKFESYLNSGEIEKIISEQIAANFDKYKQQIIDTQIYANVKNYGAVGDGVTDDTSAILKAYAANNNLYFPEGNYKITQTLILKSHTKILCSGNILLNLLDSKQVDTVTGVDFFSAYQCAIKIDNVEDIQIDGLTLIGAYDPSYGYQGVQIWADPPVNQCIFIATNSDNVRLNNITISNYSGTYNGQRIYDDDSYPFNIDIPNNGIKISSVTNLSIDGFFLKNCSSEEPFIFNCKNAIINNYISNSEMVSNLGLWYSDGSTLSNIRFLTYTNGNSLNIYSNNVTVTNLVMQGGYSTKFQKYIACTLDVSNEANVMGLTGFSTTASNVIINNAVMVNSTIQSWYPPNIPVVKVNDGLQYNNFTFFFGNEVYHTGSTSQTQNTCYNTTINTYGKVTCNNWNVVGNSIVFVGVQSTLDLTFNNLTVNSSQAADIPSQLFTLSGCQGQVSINDSSITCRSMGLASGNCSLFFNRSNLSVINGLQYGGNPSVSFTFDSCTLNNPGNYSAAYDSIGCFIVVNPVSTNLQTVTLTNNIINSPTVLKMHGTMTSPGTINLLKIIGNEFINEGGGQFGYSSVMIYKVGTIIYSNNIISPTAKANYLSLRNYDTLICTNNTGINANFEANVLSSEVTASMNAYVFNNNFLTTTTIKAGEAAYNRTQSFANDPVISSAASAPSVFTAFNKWDIVPMKDVPSFMYPSGMSSTTGRLFMFPRSQTILYIPIGGAANNIMQYGYNNGTTIVWNPLKKNLAVTGDVRYQGNSLQYYNGTSWVNVPAT